MWTYRVGSGTDYGLFSDVSVQRVTADRCGIFGTYFAYVDGAEMVDTSAADTNHALDFRACKICF